MKQSNRRVSASALGVFVGFGLTLVNGGCQREQSAASEARGTQAANPLFVVAKDKKYGFINREGNVMIDLQFDGAADFSDGLANICVGPCKFVKNNPKEEFTMDQTFQGTHGFIDPQGKMVINPRFTAAGSFHHGLAAATTGEYRLLDNTHQTKYGYIDKSGSFVIPEQFQSANDFNESGIAVACIGGSEQPRCGFIDTKGKFIINPQFYSANNFSNGLAGVIEKKGMSSSYIDRTGHIVWKGGPEEWESLDLIETTPKNK